MNIFEYMNCKEGYACRNEDLPYDLQEKCKLLCYKYNQTTPDQKQLRAQLIQELIPGAHPLTFIEPSFHCDYGFNIHTHGLTVVNYNCVFLDTSSINIGKNVFIAPGTCLACSGHAIDSIQRSQGIGTSAPINIGDDVWIGANVTVCGGVSIGNGSIIGAGSVVVKDIPSGVVAVGNPCKVIRPITPHDIVEPVQIDKGDL